MANGIMTNFKTGANVIGYGEEITGITIAEGTTKLSSYLTVEDLSVKGVNVGGFNRFHIHFKGVATKKITASFSGFDIKLTNLPDISKVSAYFATSNKIIMGEVENCADYGTWISISPTYDSTTLSFAVAPSDTIVIGNTWEFEVVYLTYAPQL